MSDHSEAIDERVCIGVILRVVCVSAAKRLEKYVKTKQNKNNGKKKKHRTPIKAGLGHMLMHNFKQLIFIDHQLYVRLRVSYRVSRRATQSKRRLQTYGEAAKQF